MSKPFNARASFALAVLTAALLILLYPDFNFTWLAPIALAPLLIVLAREPRPLRRFLLGYVAGVIYWFGVCYWIQFVLEVHGGLGRWGGWGTFLLFCVLKALHFGLFSLLAAILMRHWYAIPAIAALWTGIERTHADLGFTWLLLGNAGIDMPLPMRLAPIVGVYGLSFVFAMISVAVALIILRRPRKQLLWLTPLVLLFALPALPAPEPTTATATLVQPAVPEEYDWTPENTAQAENRLANLTYDAALISKPQLLIWPEVPGPFYWYADPGLRQRAADLTHLTGAYFLMGTVAEDAGGPLNSAVLVNPQGQLVGRYDKMNLVPFGEFVPKIFWWVNRISQEAGDFVPGKHIVVFHLGTHKVGTFICYESAFSDFVHQFAARGANVLVNISNDGYFGHTHARAQHLELVRMRAAENARWLLRDTNDGITAIVDPAGRVTKSAPLYQATTLSGGYAYESRLTPYTKYGDWFPWCCLVAALLLLIATQIPRYEQPTKLKSGGSPARRRL